MSLTEFAMVEELASLIKHNLPCKHLVLSTEEALINFLQDDTRVDGVLELEPMNPYSRMLLHRLADIFGFSHHSVGEGDERHLILERCSETSIPSILVSDLIWQYDDVQSPVNIDVLRRKEVQPGHRDNFATQSSNERKATPFTSRESFANECETLLVKQRPQHDPKVARRMITHALGQKTRSTNHELSLRSNKKYEHHVKDVKVQPEEEGTIKSISQPETKVPSTTSPEPNVYMVCEQRSERQPEEEGTVKSISQPETKVPCTTSPEPNVYMVREQRSERTHCKVNLSADQRDDNNVQNDSSREELMGAAKRMFANALRIPQREGNPTISAKRQVKPN